MNLNLYDTRSRSIWSLFDMSKPACGSLGVGSASGAPLPFLDEEYVGENPS